MRHTGLRAAAVAWLALGGLATVARAQSSAPAEPSAPPRTARGVVVFLLPPAEQATQSELRDALLAQFALVEAEIVFEPATSAGEPLAQRVAEAQHSAAERDALAVFWIDAQAGDRWFVHMMDSERDRIVVRPVDASSDRLSAAIEAVAVMARESTRALLEGVPVPESEPAPEAARAIAPPPPPPPVPRATLPRVRALRVSGAYAATDMAEALDMRHGAALGIDWMGFAPLYAGVAYVFAPALEVDGEVDFDLQPLPLSARLGYRSRSGELALDFELGLVVEFLRSSPQRPDPASGVEPTAAQTKVLAALAPRARVELALLPELGLFGALGADVILNNFDYLVEDTRRDPPRRRTLLRGLDLRPSAELGIAFYP